MSRIATTFASLKAQGRKALIPYVTAGFPYADVTPELMHAMVAAGADVIELGVPFSDPMADGPVIQEAGEKALALGIGMVGITEGAIPFAAADPFRVIPAIMVGSMVAAVIAMLGGVGDHAPHGGPIVLPVVEGKLMFVVAIVVGSLVTALTINFVKRVTEKPASATGGNGV